MKSEARLERTYGFGPTASHPARDTEAVVPQPKLGTRIDCSLKRFDSLLELTVLCQNKSALVETLGAIRDRWSQRVSRIRSSGCYPMYSS
jgi:hypothetical protein